ncbi:hypothetical protein HanXRQr2_Chr08g0346671 [Helianthus annuus]|uniref:Uncharacterized protein n=1 Tax=Helianthus annuus TaxID=4232 RepID=A0A9K3IFN9_HELAN|nr:hypothetical protein HanXRQr2_Chr08g0346671 [Helianthus annuus]
MKIKRKESKDTCGLVVGDLGFPIGTQVQFPLVSYWGGYWAMMVTNPPRGFDPETHPDFHPAVTSARLLVWRQYGFRGNAVTKSGQPSADPVKTTLVWANLTRAID